MFTKTKIIAVIAPVLLAVAATSAGSISTASARDGGGFAERPAVAAPAKKVKKRSLKERGAERRVKKEADRAAKKAAREAKKAAKKAARAERAKERKIKRYEKQLERRKKGLARQKKILKDLAEERRTKKWTKNSDVRRHLRETEETRKAIKGLERGIKSTQAKIAGAR